MSSERSENNIQVIYHLWISKFIIHKNENIGISLKRLDIGKDNKSRFQIYEIIKKNPLGICFTAYFGRSDQYI